MTTVVTAHCDECHVDVTLRPEAVGLYTFATASSAFTDFYAFFCTACREYNSKPADNSIVELLISGGVAMHVIDVPQEVIERQNCTAPPLTLDDLLTLAADLRDHESPQEPARSHRGSSRPQGAP